MERQTVWMIAMTAVFCGVLFWTRVDLPEVRAEAERAARDETRQTASKLLERQTTDAVFKKALVDAANACTVTMADVEQVAVNECVRKRCAYPSLGRNRDKCIACCVLPPERGDPNFRECFRYTMD